MLSRAKRKLANEKARRQAQAEEVSRAACPHCVSGAETYGYLKRSWVYDVDEARRIVSDGRQPVELERDDVAYLVDNSRIHQQHIDHVNTIFPGIIAHLWGPGSAGQIEHGHLLIDGNHRAARCLRDQVPFRAYLLTEEESERILFRGMLRDGSTRDDSGAES
ncbi:MAG: hypothetical protein ACK58L_19475 [Planctomycetota bacterium]